MTYRISYVITAGCTLKCPLIFFNNSYKQREIRYNLFVNEEASGVELYPRSTAILESYKIHRCNSTRTSETSHHSQGGINVKVTFYGLFPVIVDNSFTVTN